MNNQDQNKKHFVYNFNQQEMIKQVQQKIQSLEEDQRRHEKNIKDDIYALQNFISMNLSMEFDIFENDRNMQLKIQSKELDNKKIIQDEIKKQLVFDLEVHFTRFMEHQQKCNYNQQQYNNEIQVNKYEQEINLLKENVGYFKMKMEEMEKAIYQTNHLHQKYKNLENEISKIQPLQPTLEQNIQKFQEIDLIKKYQSEISERFQKLERKNDEKYLQINKLVSDQKCNIDELQSQLSLSYNQLNTQSTKNLQNDLIEEFKLLESKNQDKLMQLGRLLNEQVQKQQNDHNILTQVINQAFQKQDEINNKLQQLEKDINSIISNKINTPMTQQPNDITQSPIFGQINQNGIPQGFKPPMTLQGQGKEQTKVFPEQKLSSIQQFVNLQKNNITFNSPIQQQQPQVLIPFQQIQIPGQQTIQGEYSSQQKQSMIQIKNYANQPNNIKFQSQIKQSLAQIIDVNFPTQITLIQKDLNRCQKIQRIINQIYDQTTRRRSASGEYQYFIREEEDYFQLQKHYGIRTIQQKQQLKEICNAFRQARGDGNCFYTAFGFQVIQIFIREYSSYEFNQLIDKLNGQFKCQIKLQNEKFDGDEFHNSAYYEFLYRLQELEKYRIQRIELNYLLNIFKLTMQIKTKKLMVAYMGYQQYSLEIQLIMQYKIANNKI
ncbi:unnamed protein product (macronuclear) [Paramecium tetraurelia]|uniref:ubiquitinyl hydrolase 1 n=1 Tax=Paramecium tetraurelia TaxID=5888 RepID=A0BX07_PARTE|nr:uncharacterized protein GSPATT00032926001 [Paramecium tetraurelia]CAK63074.1 unnamed protein product [Paramecium tetraurelia]|eukprot:XP_001430472.1 hypothetical protein (macronuclear) [Paramecium tetraurelia strain d4-2]